MAAFVEIISEREIANGWSFEVQTAGDRAARRRRLTIELSWSDYNHWSVDGSDPPQRVVEAVVTFLLSRLKTQGLPKRFDASIARRQFADADQEIPKLIQR
ncbi:MAG: hypothetical protein O6933_06355 [Planctomycetota bacterium]|nr:hypothetical protein [Planctomycetota bacterium]